LRDTQERRQQQLDGFATRGEAVKARTNALHDLGQGTHVVRDTITLAEYLQEEWLPGLAIGPLRPTTLASYRSHVRNHLAPTKLGGTRLQQLRREQIAKHYAWLLVDGRCDGETKPMSASTLRRIHATLHRALRDAVRSRWISVNPASGVELPSAHGKERTAWDSAQVRHFLESVRRDRLAPLWLLYATTGARRGELLALRWDDVDLEAQTVSIHRSLTEAGGALIEGEPKTRSGKRTIAIDPASAGILKRHRKAQTAERLAAGPKWHDMGLVFANAEGDWLLPNRISSAFIAAVTRSGLPSLSLHGLRHSFATIALVERRQPVTVVSGRLGHANVSITLDIYSHAMSRQDEEAALDVASVVVPQDF
jgi:integrase